MTLPGAELVMAAVDTFRKCGHPKTPENVYRNSRRMALQHGRVGVYWCDQCVTCTKARTKNRKRGWGDPKKARESMARVEAAFVANGRCPVCTLYRPCGGHPRAEFYASLSKPIVMPPAVDD